MSAAYLGKRQSATMTDYDDDDDFGYADDTLTGVIVKWVVFLSLLLIITAWVTFGYMHAKKRMQKGLPPLAYHRWLVPRAQLARVDPRYAYPPQQSTYANPNNNTNNYYRPGYQAQYDPSTYNMQNMSAPPPMYDPNAPRPPMYDGPQGGTKMAPNQEYEAPPGPPPPAAAAPMATVQPVVRDDTGSTNPFRA